MRTMTKEGLRAYSRMPKPWARPWTRQVLPVPSPPTRRRTSPSFASPPSFRPSAWVSSGLWLIISRGKVLPAGLSQGEGPALPVHHLHHLPLYHFPQDGDVQAFSHLLHQGRGAGEEELIVLPAAQGQLPGLGPEGLAEEGVDGDPVCRHPGPHPARLAEVAQVGDEAIADVNGRPPPQAEELLPLLHPGGGPPVGPPEIGLHLFVELQSLFQHPQAPRCPPQIAGNPYQVPRPGGRAAQVGL